MKYDKLKNQNPLHWYMFDNGKKLQTNAACDVILKAFNQPDKHCKSELTIPEISQKIKLNKNDTTHLVRRLTEKSLLGRNIRGNKSALYFLPARNSCLIYNHKIIERSFKIKSRKVHKAL